jgi:hypothetical protein
MVKISGHPSATQRVFRCCEPDQVADDPMLYDHIIFWNILELVYGHDSPENGLLVNLGQYKYWWRML